MFNQFFTWFRKQISNAVFTGIIDGSGQAVRVLSGDSVDIDPVAAEATRLQLTAESGSATAKPKRLAR